MCADILHTHIPKHTRRMEGTKDQNYDQLYLFLKSVDLIHSEPDDVPRKIIRVIIHPIVQ